MRTQNRLARRRARSRARQRRFLKIESLENRMLLAGDWHNAAMAGDVNDDGLVTPMDALLVINKLIDEGPGPLPQLAAGDTAEAFYDSSNDDYLAPVDALIVLNDLLETAPDAEVVDAVTPLLAEVKALSRHYVQATFQGPAKGELLEPDSYVVTGPDSTRLQVVDVLLGDSPREVILVTAPQQPVDYSLELKPSLLQAEGETTSFTGSINSEPYLQTAIALDDTSVLLTFNERLDRVTAENASFYRIAAADGQAPARDIAAVRIESAVLSADETTVLLTTSPMSNLQYQVKVTNVEARSGGQRIHPGFNRGHFFGIPSTDVLQLTSAVPIAETTVLLSFSEPISEAGVNPTNFDVAYCPLDDTACAEPAELLITAAELSEQGTRVTLTTLAQPAGNEFTVTARDVRGLAGNLIEQNTQTFVVAPADEEPPQLTQAVAIGPTTVLLSFSEPLAANAADPTHFEITGAGGSRLVVTRGELSPFGTQVLLTTERQAAGVEYTVTARGVADGAGNLVEDSAQNTATFLAATAASDGSVAPEDLPRLVGAVSAGNTKVRVQFSRSMGDSALDPDNYRFTIEGQEAGILAIDRDSNNDGQLTAEDAPIRWLNGDRSVVEIDVLSQSELTYRLQVFNIRDEAGNRFPDRPFLNVSSIFIEPSSTTFTGTPANGSLEDRDRDNDGLSDSVEQQGYVIEIRQADGTVVLQRVTSDPEIADTDEDGIGDFDERHYLTNPREPDTDFDDLTDFQELNEIYSDPFNQDSDGDGLTDGLEYNFFLTSPLQEDTDGDQLDDVYEIFGNRNPRVADLPTPEIELGDLNLSLRVDFSATSSEGTRKLDSKTAESSLVTTASNEFSRSSESTYEAYAKLGFSQTISVGAKGKATGFEFGFSQEVGWSGSWTNSFTETSAQETQRAVTSARTTEKEVEVGEEIERSVTEARIATTLTLRNASDVAYRIQNLQVTAFAQDPRDPGSLTPLATLVPENEPEEGFALGPLAPIRGPIAVVSQDIFPNVVEGLMANPTSVVFRITNFDIVDESERNFAFASQEVVERTGRVVIDFGGFDSDGDGQSDAAEIYQVATSSGRPIEDTNEDGLIDESDRRVTFDAEGKEVGISLRQALATADLTAYTIELDANNDVVLDPAFDPALRIPKYYDAAGNQVQLTDDELRNSYATMFIKVTDSEGTREVERLYRIRERSLADFADRTWEVLTPTGIDPAVGLDDILLAGSSFTLAYVEDKDGDLMPASLESFYGTVDSDADADGDGVFDSRDTDRDGLDDRFEALIGWQVNTPGRGIATVTSAGNRVDTDGDGLSDRDEAPEVFIDANGNGLIDEGELRRGPWQNNTGDFVTNPLDPDTDRDLLGDFEEVNGVEIQLIDRPDDPLIVSTDPAQADTDGDTVIDGLEKIFGLDPTDGADRDTDGDGLPDRVERAGWDVTTELVTLEPLEVRPGERRLLPKGTFQSDVNNPDSDGDGLTDLDEYKARTLPVDVGATGLVGIDFDANADFGGGLSPLNWTLAIGGPPEEVTYDNLTAEDGSATPYLLTLSSTGGGTYFVIPPAPDPTQAEETTFPEPARHTQSLVEARGEIEVVCGIEETCEPQDDPNAPPVFDTITSVWSGLIPGLQYEIYVFTAAGSDDTITIRGAGAPIELVQEPPVQESPVVEPPVEGIDEPVDELGLNINAQPGNPRRDLERFAQLVVADADGRITVQVSGARKDGVPDVTLAGLALGAKALRGIDTDSDGISDRDEIFGFQLGGSGRDESLVVLDPTDADFDDDGLSDGEEAELQLDEDGNRVSSDFSKRWTVRGVAGEGPRRVFTDPREPDGDFDGVPDGAEKYKTKPLNEELVYEFEGADRVFLGADPENFDTDGDRKGDFDEVSRGTNPSVAGFTATIQFDSIRFDFGTNGDGDGDPLEGANTNLNGAGDIDIEAWVRRPDPNRAFGLLESNDKFFEPVKEVNGWNQATPIRTGTTERFDDVRQRSTSVEVALNERFALGALVEEIDYYLVRGVVPNDPNDKTFVPLGDERGVQVEIDGEKRSSVFTGADLANYLGENNFAQLRLVYKFTKADNQSRVVKFDPDKMAGEVVFTMFVQ